MSTSPVLTMQDPPVWQQFVREGTAAMGVTVTEKQSQQMFHHAEELLLWNRKINLTAIVDPLEMAVKHFIDSLAPLPWLKEKSAVLDLGTGGGFPGIPLKTVSPSLNMTLVDAIAKKINFSRQVIRLLGLSGINTIQSRAEDLAGHSEYTAGFDAVISRAFASLGHFVSLAGPLVRESGRLLAMKGANVKPELDLLWDLSLFCNGRKVSAKEMFSVEVHQYNLFHFNDQRALIVLTRRGKP